MNYVTMIIDYLKNQFILFKGQFTNWKDYLGKKEYIMI